MGQKIAISILLAQILALIWLLTGVIDACECLQWCPKQAAVLILSVVVQSVTQVALFGLIIIDTKFSVKVSAIFVVSSTLSFFGIIAQVAVKAHDLPVCETHWTGANSAVILVTLSLSHLISVGAVFYTRWYQRKADEYIKSYNQENTDAYQARFVTPYSSLRMKLKKKSKVESDAQGDEALLELEENLDIYPESLEMWPDEDADEEPKRDHPVTRQGQESQAERQSKQEEVFEKMKIDITIDPPESSSRGSHSDSVDDESRKEHDDESAKSVAEKKVAFSEKVEFTESVREKGGQSDISDSTDDCSLEEGQMCTESKENQEIPDPCPPPLPPRTPLPNPFVEEESSLSGDEEKDDNISIEKPRNAAVPLPCPPPLPPKRGEKKTPAENRPCSSCDNPFCTNSEVLTCLLCRKGFHPFPPPPMLDVKNPYCRQCHFEVHSEEE